jgi:hypothetical protein
MNSETREALNEVVNYLMNNDVSRPELKQILTNLIITSNRKKEE